MHRSTIRRLRALLVAGAVLWASLGAWGIPAWAAPETPQVIREHGTLSTSVYTAPGTLHIAPGVSYGVTDNLGIQITGSKGSYDPSTGSPFQSDDRIGVTLKYELSPELAVEGFVNHRRLDDLSETMNGFGIFAGRQFGPLYASLRWRAVEVPYAEDSAIRVWIDQLTAAGSYAVAPRVSLVGTATASLDVGSYWEGSFGLEWQPTPNTAVFLQRFTGLDSTELGLEYRF